MQWAEAKKKEKDEAGSFVYGVDEAGSFVSLTCLLRK